MTRPRLADTRRQLGLDACPLLRERLLPVRLQQRGEALQHRPRVVEQAVGDLGVGYRGGALMQAPAEVGRVQRLRVSRHVAANLRAEQRDRELQAHQLRIDLAQAPKFVPDVLQLSRR